MHIDVRHASTDVYRDGFHLETILFFCDGEAHDAGLAVEGLRGVEDKVADAVVDLVTVIVLDGLEGVGVMADEHIGSSVYQHVGIVTLTRHRLGSLLHSLASTQGHHSRCDDIPIGIHKSLAPLVDRVVVGEVQVGDAMLFQRVEPFGLCAEDELFEDGCLDLRSRAFEIAHDDLGRTKDGVNAIREQMVDSVMIGITKCLTPCDFLFEPYRSPSQVISLQIV